MRKETPKEKRMGFYILFILTALIFAVYLELWKNTIVGWILAVAVFAGYFFLHAKWLAPKGGPKARWWMRLLAFVCLIALLAADSAISKAPYKQVSAAQTKDPVVTDEITVEQGKLTGIYNADESVEIYAGIPYAKPPVGELRWKEPEEPDSWEGVRACDTFAPMSMQAETNPIVAAGNKIVGYNNFKISLTDNYKEARSEDSLYLNVWRPAGTDASDKLPVLVYIHGGSLTGGQSYFNEYNGETLAKQGIVVVTITYRLGIFGYLATEELAEESENGTTGNYGLLDQIQALKWVNENIGSFGGDADNITVAGESAGASSVNALCVSPLSEGLFKRAIAESSGITAKVPYHTFRTYEEALQTGSDIMEEFGCTDMDQMREISAEDLLTSKYTNSEMTVDGYAITEQPYLTYEKGENHEEALLNGYNADEAYVFIMFGQKAKLDNYTEMLAKFSGDFAEQVEDLLPATTDKEAQANYDFAIGRAWFGYSHYTWSNYLSAENRPVYLYYFDKDNKALGTWHSGEMIYAYGNLDSNAKSFDDSDYALSDQMVAYWANFIKTGDPNGDGLPEWTTYDEAPDQIMEFGDSVGMMENGDLPLFKIIDQYQDSLAK